MTNTENNVSIRNLVQKPILVAQDVVSTDSEKSNNGVDLVASACVSSLSEEEEDTQSEKSLTSVSKTLINEVSKSKCSNKKGWVSQMVAFFEELSLEDTSTKYKTPIPIEEAPKLGYVIEMIGVFSNYIKKRDIAFNNIDKQHVKWIDQEVFKDVSVIRAVKKYAEIENQNRITKTSKPVQIAKDISVESVVRFYEGVLAWNRSELIIRRY